MLHLILLWFSPRANRRFYATLLSPAFKPGWRNWQTQRTQNPPRFTPRGGSTPPPGTSCTPVISITYSMLLIHVLLAYYAWGVMLTLYRRHRTNCKHKGRRYKSCFCPIWVQGTLRGERIRHSLDLTNWEAANRLTRDWEIEGKASSLSVRDACERFVSDCEHGRKLSEGMLKKYKHVTAELTVKLGDMPLRSVSVDELRRLRE